MGVQPCPKDDDGGDDRSGRAEQVAHHVQQGPAHVEIGAPPPWRRIKQRAEVHQKTDARNDEHGVPGDRDRFDRGG